MDAAILGDDMTAAAPPPPPLLLLLLLLLVLCARLILARFSSIPAKSETPSRSGLGVRFTPSGPGSGE